MKKIALLSCADLTGYVTDENFLEDAFKAKGYSVEMRPWTDNVNWSEYSAAIIRTTWDYTKNPEKFFDTLEKIEHAGCKVMNAPSVVRWNLNKAYLKELEKKGIDIIPTEVFFAPPKGTEIPGEVLERIESFHSPKLAIKPCIGANAEGLRVMQKANVREDLKKLEAKPCGWLIQPFQEEILGGEISFHFFNKKFSHAILKVPKENDFRVQEEHGGIITSYQPSLDQAAAAKKVLDSIDSPLLYARVDMVKTKQGMLLMEVELIEPALYFRMDKDAAARFVVAYEEFVR